MALKFEVDEQSLRRLRANLQGMRERARDVRPAWDAVVEWFADRNASQFEDRGAEYATPWRPLAASTLREKARLGFPLDPLVRTRRLMQSITMRPLDIERLGPREFEAGTADRKAVFHQFGTRNGLPARPLFSATRIRASNAVTYAIANWIIDGRRSVAPRRRTR